ncbi:MAG: chemotaxis protein CheW [Leptolyngbyaceae cyanobacterium bins.59]|nr:chemotaxis protein CheW [Leptolyngbyaceae cyanobacterium bins.59]
MPLLPPLTRPPKATGIPFLKLYLPPWTPILIPMEQAQEVLILPIAQLTCMPDMPPCVLGLINRRSRIFWLVDLGNLLGFAPLPPTLPHYRVTTVRVGQTALGLAVQDIRGVVRVSPDQIQPIQGSIGEQLTPYLKGMVLQQDDVLLILNPEAIGESPILQAAN